MDRLGSRRAKRSEGQKNAAAIAKIVCCQTAAATASRAIRSPPTPPGREPIRDRQDPLRARSLAHHPIISPKRPPPSIKRSVIAIDTDRSRPLINSGCFARFVRCFWHRSSVPPSSTCYVSAVTTMMFRGIKSDSWLIYVESWSKKHFRAARA